MSYQSQSLLGKTATVTYSWDARSPGTWSQLWPTSWRVQPDAGSEKCCGAVDIGVHQGTTAKMSPRGQVDGIVGMNDGTSAWREATGIRFRRRVDVAAMTFPAPVVSHYAYTGAGYGTSLATRWTRGLQRRLSVRRKAFGHRHRLGPNAQGEIAEVTLELPDWLPGIHDRIALPDGVVYEVVGFDLQGATAFISGSPAHRPAERRRRG